MLFPSRLPQFSDLTSPLERSDPNCAVMSGNPYGNGDIVSEMSGRSGLANGFGGYRNGGMSAMMNSGNGMNRQASAQLEHHQPRAYANNQYGDDERMPYEHRTLDRAALGHGYAHYQASNAFDPPQGPWNGGQFSSATVGANSRMRNGPSRRGPIPQWSTEPPSQSAYGMQQTPPLPHMNNYSPAISNGMSNGQAPVSYGQNLDEDEAEELIPTAIVIKNIPFAVKREQLAALMADLGLPAPYAFNYHFDAGVFRGLAFANFQNPQDTADVINAMNHMELQGRKLRVEYKKMLPAQERDRIEREKRQRRGQLEEQHRPMDNSRSLTMQPSYSSLNSAQHPLVISQSTSPSPVSLRGPASITMNSDGKLLCDSYQILAHVILVVDFNDPWTLNTHTDIILFKRDNDKEVTVLGPLTDRERRIVHEIAHGQGLFHTSVPHSGAEGGLKSVRILKKDPSQLMMPPEHFGNNSINYRTPIDDRSRLSRAATTDFTEPREGPHSGLRTQNSGFLNVDNGPFNQNLRAAKSFSDLQNRAPSPANSQGFPAELANNLTRYASGYPGNNSSAGSLVPPRIGREDLSSSFGSLTISGSLGAGNNSRVDTNGRLGAVGSTAGAIGSHRSNNALNGIHDDSAQQSRANTLRQPRGPERAPEGWPSASGFARNRQRGSTDLDAESTESLDSPISNSHLTGRFSATRN